MSTNIFRIKIVDQKICVRKKTRKFHEIIFGKRELLTDEKDNAGA